MLRVSRALPALAVLIGLAIPSGAAAKTIDLTASCSRVVIVGSDAESVPVELPGAPESAVLGQFSVLRRPALASDELPPLNPAGSELEGELTSYYPSYIRQLADTPNGARWFLVPGLLRVSEVPPARCLPASLRKERRKLVEQQSARRTQPAYCLVQVGGVEAGRGTECGLFSEVSNSLGIFSSGLDEQPIPALVPDGVAAVRVSYEQGVSVTVAVSENGYLLSTPPAVAAERRKLENRLNRSLPKSSKHLSKAQTIKALKRIIKGILSIAARTDPTELQWLNAAGVVIRTVSRSSSSAASQLEATNLGLAATAALAIR